MKMKAARERIRDVVEHWFLSEPLFLAVWTLHALAINPRIDTIRVHQGRVEYNPAFIDALSKRDLRQVLQFEAMRIVLKHPYSRRKENPQLGYFASNITLQEYLLTDLPMLTAAQAFATDAHNLQYYEYYYTLLSESAACPPPNGDAADDGNIDDGGADGGGTDGNAEHKPELAVYADPSSGAQNAEHWDADDLFTDSINTQIHIAEETNQWGSVAGRLKEKILASLKPRLNYRAVLRRFRASILSTKRILTRMKPSRRYGFLYLGSRRDFSTRLLVAVDVSGSMSHHDLVKGFSVVNRLFKYGVESIDVIQFDTQIQGQAMSLKRARQQVTVLGRGGTCFNSVMEYIDQHRQYDGVIVYTDGYAPQPVAPNNRKTRIMWLFKHENNWRDMQTNLRQLGFTAYLQEDQT